MDKYNAIEKFTLPDENYRNDIWIEVNWNEKKKKEKNSINFTPLWHWNDKTYYRASAQNAY